MVGNDTSHKIQETLDRSFAIQSQAKIMQYKLRLQSIKNGTMNVIEYLTKIKACSNILASTCHCIFEEDQILYVVASLGNEYDPIVVTITSRESPYSFKDVGVILQSFETRIECIIINSDGTFPSVNMAFHNNQGCQSTPRYTNNLSHAPNNFTNRDQG